VLVTSSATGARRGSAAGVDSRRARGFSPGRNAREQRRLGLGRLPYQARKPAREVGGVLSAARGDLQYQASGGSTVRKTSKIGSRLRS